MKIKETQLIPLFHINNIDCNWPLEKLEHNRGLFVRPSADYMLLSAFMMIAFRTTASQAHLKLISQAASSWAAPSRQTCPKMDVTMTDIFPNDISRADRLHELGFLLVFVSAVIQ